MEDFYQEGEIQYYSLSNGTAMTEAVTFPYMDMKMGRCILSRSTQELTNVLLRLQWY